MNPQPVSTFSRGAEKLLWGADALGIHHEVFEANIVGCRGCGYCNIGCQFGAKLSMLDKVLPKRRRSSTGTPPTARCASSPTAKRSES